jgi:SAM-dependent methyltransferase
MTSTSVSTAAAAFNDADVAACYRHRPPYAEALYERLLALAPGRRRALDLGCGPGKIAGRLAAHFGEVVAVDPSEPMIAEGRAAHAQGNIRWVPAAAESADLTGAFDLVTAGTAVHWMDPAILFPRLADLTGLVAIVTGDAPCAAPWLDAWHDFNVRWVTRLGGVWGDAAHQAASSRHEPWIDIAGAETFDFSHSQSLASFIACQHSRATYARTAMGAELTAAFDADAASLLTPWVVDGLLTYDVRSELAWGAPRRTAQR